MQPKGFAADEMDILIDLIVLLIKQASKSRQPTAAPPPLPQTTLAQQVQAMQKAVAAQQARTRAAPAAARAGKMPASWSQPGVRAAVPPVSQPPVPAINPSRPGLQRGAAPSTRIPGLKLPFLLGEVLSPPVALREEQW